MEIDPIVKAAFGPPPPDIDLTEDQRVTHNIVVFVLLFIAAVSVILRFVARIKSGPGLSYDDYLIVVAWTLDAITAIMTTLIGESGAGRHVWALRATDISTTSKLLYIYSFIFCVAVLATKSSILLFYRRVFTNSSLSFRLSFWFGAFLVYTYPVYFMITMGLCCRPLSHFWMQYLGSEGKCIDVGYFFMILAAINLVTDIILLIIPIPQILKLQMSTTKKTGVCGIMLLGSFVCVASAIRTHELNVFAGSLDTTWQMGPVAIWSSVEASIGIVSACLPSLKPLLRKLRGKGTTTTSRSGTSGLEFSDYQGSRARKSRFDDEIALRSQVVGGEGSLHSSSGSDHLKGISVRTDVKQSFTERNEIGA